MYKDEIICKMRYFESNFASKVETHGISWKKILFMIFVEFRERKNKLFILIYNVVKHKILALLP